MPASISEPLENELWRGWPTSWWCTPRSALYCGDVVAKLKSFPTRSVHCAVTSPPYWGLRNYSMCDCATVMSAYTANSTLAGGGNVQRKDPDPECKKCGGTGQIKGMETEIGREPLPDCGTYGQAQCRQCFVCSMVGVFRELHRVLRDDGTLWLNLGDSYTGVSQTGGTSGKEGSPKRIGRMFNSRSSNRGSFCGQMDVTNFGTGTKCDLPEGNLVGIPWRVALALQADGWILRQDVIWAKPNPMRESVTSRCTKSHEYIFHLTKSMEYYFDHVAIQTESAQGGKHRIAVRETGDRVSCCGADRANKLDVWFVPPKAYPGAHYATFSPELITPCILAGTSAYGCCAACGTPWERVVVKVGDTGEEYNHFGATRKGPAPGQAPTSSQRKGYDRSLTSNRNGMTEAGSTLSTNTIPKRETVGWEQKCGCQGASVEPCIVLDPFSGSGTTVATSLELGRRGVGIDLSEQYLTDDAVPRIEESIRSGRVVGETPKPIKRGSKPPTRTLPTHS